MKVAATRPRSAGILLGFALLILCGLHQSVRGEAFPIFSQADDMATTPGIETWAPWPFGHRISSSTESMTAFHPIFSYYKNKLNESREFHLLWPLVDWSYEKEAWGEKDRRRLTVLPLWYSASGVADSGPYWLRYLFPLYFEGEQAERGGKYFIVFPFLWYARNAKLTVPLFPHRPQNFTAVWPLAGDFRGYYNSDRTRFLLWPLFVESWDHEGDDPFKIYSLIWPFFSLYQSDNDAVHGFRVWPLFSRVKHEGEFTRAYWLWPLGHYRKGRISQKNDGQEEVLLFLPFYGKVRRPTYSYDMIFPFYGKLDMKGRKTRGYALALYNENDNLRTGIREHRLLWFLIRWTTNIPRDLSLTQGQEREGMEGGGFFPFYVHRYMTGKDQKTILWPFFSTNYDRYKDYEFDRTYLMPLYSNQVKRYNDGNTEQRKYVFPFFRKWRMENGDEYRSVLHLWFYSKWDGIDRNWAPLWTVWEKRANTETGEARTHVVGHLYTYDKNWLGVERSAYNLLVFSTEKYTGPHRPEEHHTRFFWGLVGHHQLGEKKQWEFFGKRF
ncbi:hypothetical protein KQI84_16310 [bacterium]|nr:hypothetical protein [bacterium]